MVLIIIKKSVNNNAEQEKILYNAENVLTNSSGNTKKKDSENPYGSHTAGSTLAAGRQHIPGI